MGKIYKPPRDRIRIHFVPQEGEILPMPKPFTSVDTFGYSLADMDKAMAIPNDETVDLPSASGFSHRFRRGLVSHWEVIEKKDERG